MTAPLSSLSQPELALIRETERERLAALDEDALVDLHQRVRRARDKYVKLYRRQASARVMEAGARGAARPRNRHNADRAEVFEDALARVSRRLAVVAGESARALRAERLEAARSARASGPTAAAPGAAKRTAKRAAPKPATSTPATKSPARKKQEASTLAQGARRQAKRDTR